MSARRDEPFSPQAWIERAESSLARAGAGFGVPGILLEDLCFDAQQAAEKALKALLVSRGQEFPKTHAVAHLLTLLEQAGAAIPEDIKRATDLTPYAVHGRYPGGPEVTETDYHGAVELARGVVQWVKHQLGAAKSEP